MEGTSTTGSHERDKGGGTASANTRGSATFHGTASSAMRSGRRAPSFPEPGGFFKPIVSLKERDCGSAPAASSILSGCGGSSMRCFSMRGSRWWESTAGSAGIAFPGFSGTPGESSNCRRARSRERGPRSGMNSNSGREPSGEKTYLSVDFHRDERLNREKVFLVIP